MKHRISIFLMFSSFLISGCSSKPINNKKEITFAEWHQIAENCEKSEYEYLTIKVRGYTTIGDVKISLDRTQKYDFNETNLLTAIQVNEADYSLESRKGNNTEMISGYCKFYDNLSFKFHVKSKDSYENSDLWGYKKRTYSETITCNFNKYGDLIYYSQNAEAIYYADDGTKIDNDVLSYDETVTYFNGSSK